MPAQSAATRLQALREAERRGQPFLAYADDSGVQHIRVLDDVSPSQVSIGRSPDAGLALLWDPDTSRLHALLERIGDVWTVLDDGLSRNGTFLNGQRLGGRRRLSDGDRLRCGQVEIVFRDPADRVRTSTAVNRIRPLAAPSPAQLRVLTALVRPLADADVTASVATNAQIAEELHLSVSAVKTHIRALCERFGVEDLPQNQKRTRLADLAVRSGLVAPTRLGEGEGSPPD
jgi:pSer/pThr/pTyr-binding forkhead associated (FHA) protein